MQPIPSGLLAWNIVAIAVFLKTPIAIVFIVFLKATIAIVLTVFLKSHRMQLP